MALSVWQHTKAELGFIARSWLRPQLLAMGLFAVLYALVLLFDTPPPEPEQPSKLVLTPLALIYGAVVGFWPGMIVGGARTAWRLVGAWTLVPLTLIPLSILLALLLGAPLLAAEGAALVDAIWTVGAEREWLSASMGRIGHAGPVALVIILPMLLLDLGVIALHPSVLVAMALLLLTFTLLIAAAAIPSALVSLLVLARAYILGLRERVATRNEDQAQGRPLDPAAPS